MTEPRSFLHVTTFYPPYHFGGDAVYVQRLGQALTERGHHVEVAHNLDAFSLLGDRAASPQRGLEPPPRPAAVHGLTSPLGALAPLLAHQTGWPWLYARALRSIMSRRHFDVIHYHNISLFGPGVLTLGGGAATAKLYTVHEHWLVCPTHVLWKLGRRPCERPECFRCVLTARRPPQWWRYTSLLERRAAQVDRFIAPNRTTADMHRRRGFATPFDLLPLFAPRADRDWQVPGPRPNGRPYFVFVGRLETFKGVHTLLPIFEHLDADLLIAGEGPQGPALRAQAAGNPRVRFLGRLSEAELGPVYTHAVACLVPSQTYETFGTITLEAFARKTPVIAHDLGATGEPVRASGGGFTYRSDRELRDAMERLLADDELRRQLGERAYQMFLERWSPEPHVRGYLDIVDAALRDRVPSRESTVNILMYHSISDGRGPLCLTPAVFRQQLDALAARRLQGVSLRHYVENRLGLIKDLDNAVVLTFDDGYADLADVVAPELARRGWSATVFLSPRCIDAGRLGPRHLPEKLLPWSMVEQLVSAAWEIGSHAMTHRDLTRLPALEMEAEIRDSRRDLEQRLGTAVTSFAAPFGRTTRRVRDVVAAHYKCAVGTRLAVARDRSNLFDLPRVEMWYFRNPARWHAHLDGTGGLYFRGRQFMRGVRLLARGRRP